MAMILLALSLSLSSCGKSDAGQSGIGSESSQPAESMLKEEVKDDGKGIGPVKEVSIAEIDKKMVGDGQKLFEAKCAACHKVTDQKVVGPGLKGVTQRRKPEWIMNMILNPEEMTKKDPTAMALLEQHLTQMTNQNVAETDARAILEYFRSNDAQN